MGAKGYDRPAAAGLEFSNDIEDVCSGVEVDQSDGVASNACCGAHKADTAAGVSRTRTDARLEK